MVRSKRSALSSSCIWRARTCGGSDAAARCQNSVLSMAQAFPCRRPARAHQAPHERDACADEAPDLFTERTPRRVLERADLFDSRIPISSHAHHDALRATAEQTTVFQVWLEKS